MSDCHPETTGDVRALLTSHGLAPNKRFGQNFLIEPPILDRLIRLADLQPDDLVLEVGTGTGNLTRRLARATRFVVTVEIDRGLHSLAQDLLDHPENVRFVHGDILDGKSALNQEVAEKVDTILVDPNVENLKVVANLPYNISTPFLSNLLLRFGSPRRMVLTVQKELAENLTAEPGSKTYSPLTVLLRHLCDISIDRVLPGTVFWPRPDVESAIVVLNSNGEPSEPALRAHALTQYLFSERRKAIRGLIRKLPPAMGGPLSSESVDQILEAAEVTGTERAEALEGATFVALNRAIASCAEMD